MAGLKPPRVPGQAVPVFAEGELARLERACAGRGFQERRDADPPVSLDAFEGSASLRNENRDVPGVPACLVRPMSPQGRSAG
jgi:hypothetical protein